MSKKIVVFSGLLALTLSAAAEAKLNRNVTVLDDKGKSSRRQIPSNKGDEEFKDQAQNLNRLEGCMIQHLDIKNTDWKRQARIQSNIQKFQFVLPDKRKEAGIPDGSDVYYKGGVVYIVADPAKTAFAKKKACSSDLAGQAYEILDNQAMAGDKLTGESEVLTSSALAERTKKQAEEERIKNEEAKAAKTAATKALNDELESKQSALDEAQKKINASAQEVTDKLPEFREAETAVMKKKLYEDIVAHNEELKQQLKDGKIDMATYNAQLQNIDLEHMRAVQGADYDKGQSVTTWHLANAKDYLEAKAAYERSQAVLQEHERRVQEMERLGRVMEKTQGEMEAIRKRIEEQSKE